MNRLQFGPLALVDPPQLNRSATCDLPIEASQPQKHERCGSGILRHNIYIPSRYEPNYAYPLVIFLHDDQQSTASIDHMMITLTKQNFLGAAIYWPKLKRSPSDGSANRAAWSQDAASIERTQASIADCIDQVDLRFNFNRRKIFLMGLGSGASMAMNVGLQHPAALAGVISLDGNLPSPGENDGRPLARLKEARKVRLFWAHYRQSQRMDESTICSGLTLLHSGGFGVVLRQYPLGKEGHDSVLADVNQWLIDEVTRAE